MAGKNKRKAAQAKRPAPKAAKPAPKATKVAAKASTNGKKAKRVAKAKPKPAEKPKPIAKVAATPAIESVDATPEKLRTLRAALVPLTDAEIAALDAEHSDPECDNAGTKTVARDAIEDAYRFFVVASDALHKYPESIHCAPEYLSYFNSILVRLEGALAEVKGGDPVAARDRSEPPARRERAALLATLERVAGSDENLLEGLGAATGRAEKRTEVLDSLAKLIALGRSWLASPNAAAHVRARMYRLTSGRLDEAGRAMTALANASGEAFAGGKQTKDPPQVNRIEGRMLFAMKTLLDVFDAAHEENSLVPRLVPTKATRHFFSHPKSGGRDAPVPPPAS